MPLKRCTKDGKQGWKWGERGKCYTGKEGKKKAIRQGIRIEGPTRFKEIMEEEKEVEGKSDECITDREYRQALADYYIEGETSCGDSETD